MMAAALKLHYKISTDLLERLHGYEVKTDGDAFMYAFSDPIQAVNFCLRTQCGMFSISYLVSCSNQLIQIIELVKAPWSLKLLEIPECAPVT